MECNEAPPTAFRKGVEAFNEGAYFEAHETLETLWKAESGPVRDLLQGVIQLAAGMHHVRGGNQKGALALVERAVEKLAPYQVCLGIDVTALRGDADRLAARLRELGPGELDTLPLSEAPRVKLPDA